MKDEKSQSAAARVYQGLRQAILDRVHLPGEVVSRTCIARTYATSKTPVREALLRLEREGLVLVKPQAGTVIAPIRVPEVHQAQFLRHALEVDVVRRLALRPAKRDLTSARQTLDNKTTPAAFAATDRAFHRALFAAVGMEDLFLRVEPLLTSLARCRALAPADEERIRAALADHRDILNRIEMADADGASRAMSAHLASSLAGLGKLQINHSAMFATD